jgi:putative component of membrane protein insertase Oxa1/YidC/SpoIIIJ protein YidD
VLLKRAFENHSQGIREHDSLLEILLMISKLRVFEHQKQRIKRMRITFTTFVAKACCYFPTCAALLLINTVHSVYMV